MAKRGFGSPRYNKELQREVARRGGKAAQEKGTGHAFRTRAEASAAGKRGAAVRKALRRQRQLEEESRQREQASQFMVVQDDRGT